MTVNIAMWSGPRNISTAMMYSFGNRPDCFAWDEPFYAFSLLHHGNDHPMRAEILAAYETDYAALAARCLATPPAGKTVFYQKHMTHHMLEGFDRAWIGGMANAFLIRAPEKVLASYVRKWTEVSLRDIGFVEQGEIFKMLADRSGRAPPVIDAEDVLADPRAMLGKLCTALGISFRDDMLSWQPGPKPFDGLWAGHWYEAAWKSTGFERHTKDTAAVALPGPLRRIADAARPIYEALRTHRLTKDSQVLGT
jgi:hypothetical protein